jgi:hypothetical protein
MKKVLLTAMLILFVPMALGAEKPQVIGYGVKSCESYLDTFESWEQGQEEGISEYRRYRDWFSGMVTGLSLATDMDVLKGVEIKGALRRVQIYCDEHPTEDFFTASMNLIRVLSSLH